MASANQDRFYSTIRQYGSHKVTLPKICSSDEMAAYHCLVSAVICSNDCCTMSSSMYAVSAFFLFFFPMNDAVNYKDYVASVTDKSLSCGVGI
jgi:hypothetical protein